MSAADVDASIAGFPPEIAERLTAVREALLRAVPDADEVIRYDMPAVMLGGRYAIHFAGWRQHIGLYPVPGLDAKLKQDVAPLRSGRDSVVLEHHVPLPVELIERIATAIATQRGKR